MAVFHDSATDCTTVTLNTSDGRIFWRRPINAAYSSEILDVDQDFIAVGDSGSVAIYKTVSGEMMWKNWFCRNQLQAYFYGTTIYIPCTGIQAIDIDSGKTIWETTANHQTPSSIFFDGVIYSSPNAKEVFAFDVVDRKFIWSTRLDGELTGQYYRISGEYLFVTIQDKLCVLKREDGKLKWCRRVGYLAHSPTLLGDRVYIFDETKNDIIVFDISNGDQIGKLSKSVINFIPVIYDKQLMFSSNGTLIFANGQEIFSYGK